MPLAIVHHDDNRRPVDGPAPVWRTCLRTVAFFEDAGATDARQARAFTDAAAYRELLEILCGLRSPMVGETQVLGQFRTFLAGLAPEHAWLRPLGQRLLADAKLVRERHLRRLGSRSYGSAVRRHLEGADVVALVGAGTLADEILPFLADGDRRVDQWTRRLRSGRAADSVVPRLIADAGRPPAEVAPAVLVIAAPIDASDAQRIAVGYARLCRVVDLRAERDDDAAPAGVPVVTLSDLFARMEADRRAAAAQIDAARREIARLSDACARREQLRPFGWDDLCA